MVSSISPNAGWKRQLLTNANRLRESGDTAAMRGEREGMLTMDLCFPAHGGEQIEFFPLEANSQNASAATVG